MPSGPPPTPNEVLRKRGGLGHKDRLRSVPPPATLERVNPKRPPKPPRPLDADGMSLWRRVWRSGADWVSPDTDLERVLVLCEMTDEVVRVRRRIRAAEDLLGDDMPLSGVEKRMYDTLRDLRKQIGEALSHLGFTPADRARMNVAEVAALDPLDEFRAEDMTG